MILRRRTFLAGIGALLCAPAIVRASSLMPISALEPEVWHFQVMSVEDVNAFLVEEVLPLARRRLVAYEFGEWRGMRFLDGEAKAA